MDERRSGEVLLRAGGSAHPADAGVETGAPGSMVAIREGYAEWVSGGVVR